MLKTMSKILRTKGYLKLVSAIFYQIFIYHQMIALKKYEKCFLFHLKSSFRSRDIQVFVYSIASAVDLRKIFKFMTPSTV